MSFSIDNLNSSAIGFVLFLRKVAVVDRSSVHSILLSDIEPICWLTRTSRKDSGAGFQTLPTAVSEDIASPPLPVAPPSSSSGTSPVTHPPRAGSSPEPLPAHD